MASPKQRYVINPETGRRIIVGRNTYRRLVGTGTRPQTLHPAPAPKHGPYYQVPSVRTGHFPPAVQRAAPRSLATEIAQARARDIGFPRRQYRERQLRRLEQHAGSGRGSRLRGWTAVEPVDLGERAAEALACGQRCFLAKPRPGASGRAKHPFPICDANCHIDPRGVLAAEVRAKSLATQMRKRQPPDLRAAREYDRIAQAAMALKASMSS